MHVWVKIFEGEVSLVTCLLKSLHHCGPIGRAIKQWPESFQRIISTLLGVFLEMHILNALSQHLDPMLGKLKHHDVACVKMNLHIFGFERINEVVHFTGRHQVAIEKNVLDV